MSVKKHGAHRPVPFARDPGRFHFRLVTVAFATDWKCRAADRIAGPVSARIVDGLVRLNSFLRSVSCSERPT